MADLRSFKERLTKATKPQQNRISPSLQEYIPGSLLVKRRYLLVFEAADQDGQQFFSTLHNSVRFEVE